jgi:tetratricopeptide (TPR) repeat protein
MPAAHPIHRRRLVAVGVILTTLTGAAVGGFVYRRHQIDRNFRRLRADGLAADARHEPVKAVDLLGQYLARYPDDVPALTRYADDRMSVPLPDDGQVGLTIQALRYALHLDPALADQRRTLMSLYLKTGYWTEALETADQVLAADPPGRAKADREPLAARASALARLRRINEATTAATAWCAADPGSVDARLLRLDLGHVAGDPPIQADAMIRTWAASPALTKTAADLLRGHARVLDSDPSAARAPLTAAAHDAPFDPQSAAPLERDLDLVGLPDLALEVAKARQAADPSDLAARIDLVRREWIDRQFQAVIDLVTPVKDRGLLPSETLGLEAVAKSELGQLVALTPIEAELSARPDATARAWAAVVGQLSSGKFEPDKLLAACGPALTAQDGPILRYYVGESYLSLGDPQRAAREWQRVVGSDPAWPLPAVRLCQLLTEQARPKEALTAGYEAVRRAPHDAVAATAMATAWAAAVDAGQDDDIDGCLLLLTQLIKQLPTDTNLPPLQATVLARAGRGTDTAAVIRGALSSKQVLPEQSWFTLAAASTTLGLGLEQQCLARSLNEHGITPRSAYARAVSLHFAALDQSGPPANPLQRDPGLGAFDADHAAAPPSPDLAWQLARARYLDVTGNTAATAAWAGLSAAHPQDADVQRLAVSAASVQADPSVMRGIIDRLMAIGGPDSPAYELARARFDISFGKTPADATDSRKLLDNVLRQSPDSLEARLLSARAYEIAGRIAGAVADLRAAVAINPESVPVRLALARLLQSQGDFQGAIEQFDHLDLKRLTTDDQRQQAAALLAQHGQADRAIDLLHAADPSPIGRLMLARLYQRTGQSERAIGILDDLLKTRTDPAALAYEADLLASAGQMHKARQLLDRLHDLPPGVADLIRADFALRHDSPTSPDAALALFASATTADPSNANAWRARVAAELSVNRPADAVAVATEGAKPLPTDPVLAFFRDNGPAVESAAAEPAAGPILTAAVRDPSVIPAATEALTLMQPAVTGDQSLDWLAMKFTELAGKYPTFAPIDLYLIDVQQRAGRLDDAVGVATRAAQAFPDDPAVLRAETDALFKDARWSEVISVAAKWKRQIAADGLAADLIAAEAMIESGRAKEVAPLLGAYIEHPGGPGYVPAVAVVGRARVASGQTEPELGMTPLLQQGAAGRAAWMKFAVDLLPADEADAAIQRAVKSMPADDWAEHVTASEAWAKLAGRTGSQAYAAAAVLVLTPFLSGPNPPVPVLLASASWSEKLGKAAAAESLYRRVLAIVPNQPDAGNNLAMILARSDRTGAALELIDAVIKAKAARPNADLYDTRAFVHLKAGRFDAAIADIDHALRMAPTRVSFRVRRVQILSAAGRSRDAEADVRRLNADFPDGTQLSPEIRNLLTEARQAVGR